MCDGKDIILEEMDRLGADGVDFVYDTAPGTPLIVTCSFSRDEWINRCKLPKKPVRKYYTTANGFREYCDPNDNVSYKIKEIKKCPMCGGEPITLSVDEYNIRMYRTACSECGVSTRRHTTVNGSIRSWNGRV